MIESERLRFHPWTPDDLEDALRLWGSAEVMALLGGPLDRAAVGERLAREMQTAERYGFQYWKVTSKADGAFVGCCGLKPGEWLDGEIVECGFHLMKQWWGGGYAGEAAAAVVRWTFGELGRDRLYAGHHPENRASQRVLAKLGFQRAGEKFYPPTGLIHPWYELRRR
jgi:[ribosomal protein S5]-alanine N-acetyltransferase